MNQQTIQQLQKEFFEEQKKIYEIVSSLNNEVTVEIDGFVQITSIKITTDKCIEELKPALIYCINTAIKNVSEKVRILMMSLELKINNKGI